METGEILKRLRLNSGLTHTEMAKRAGISRSWVYAVEKGDCASPSIEVVRNWVDVCKPKGDKTEWLALACQLLFKEFESLEKDVGANTEAESQGDETSSWISKLVPKWFKK